MPSRFERFSEPARRVLSLAQEEAQRFNHNYIGTEHILLGLTREPDGTAAQILTSLGVDLAEVRAAVEHIVGRGKRPAPGWVGLTPRAKKIIELAVNESRRRGGPIGTEHLLIGVVREGEGVGATVLASLGITLDRVLEEMRRLENGAAEGPPPRLAENSQAAESGTWAGRGSGPAGGRTGEEGDASDDPLRDPTPDEIRRVLSWLNRQRGGRMVTYSSAPSSWSVVGRRLPWWRRWVRRMWRG